MEQAIAEAPVQVTQSAVNKISQLIADEGNDALKLRIYVSGGGCSGFQYGFAFEKEAAEDDTTIVESGISLLVDPMSYPYLSGSVLDYVDDLSGAQFVVRNPNAQTTCGCGSSFSI